MFVIVLVSLLGSPFSCPFLHLQFFKKHGVVSVKDEYHLFNQVTGLDLHGYGEEFLAQVIISC